ncbi:serine/threonine-protein kinase haspin homolog isoform X2 [Drosophila takahashii]|uniref:serine/threonine-protein kinase haspin homolog isoform X2 n=1 Tax=Drosophila takahashii TaxID=29030 RepID=UPI003898E16F
MENSSGDERWKDSFDKLLDARSQLRNSNIIKKIVKVSFNIESSVENSSHSLEEIKPNTINMNLENYYQSGSMSTPSDKRLSKELFNCGLSPITRIKLDGFGDCSDKCHTEQDVQTNLIEKTYLEVPSQNIIKTSKPRFNKSNKIIGAVLKPGKWRKSLNIFRRTQISDLNFKNKLENRSSECQGRKSLYLKDLNKKKYICEQDFFYYCNQSKPLKFNSAYAHYKMLNTYKIGEGAYGEVFRYTAKKGCDKPSTDLVLKIIPIEGSVEINGEKQKTFSQILPEIIITKEMSSLQGFANIRKVSTVKGKYPKHFITQWERYNNEKGSENDHPGLFEENQLFVVLELNFAGCDMSNFIFINSEQSYYALQQIILALAIGEEEYQFEHRDLHWGNILIESTAQKRICFKFQNSELNVLSKGATGDYQYDIYRMMRNELKNNWTCYSPKTNILWLSYVIVKIMGSVKYKSINTKVHKLHIDKLKELQSIILTFESASHCAKYLFNLT